MKKILPLAIIALTIGFIPHVYNVNASDDITISNEKATNFLNALKGKIELSTNIEFGYDNFIPSLQLIDQLGDSARVNKVSLFGYTVQESYISKLKDGTAAQQYISISNTVEQTVLTDNDGNTLKFDELFASPFARLTKLSADQVNKYFLISETSSNGYQLKATDLAYGTLTSSLLNFYSDYDAYYWDLSVSESINNLVFTLDGQGIPTSLSFEKIKKDKFGGIRESYDVDIEVLQELESLQPIKTTLTTEAKNNFVTKMNNFQEKLNKGNFTQNVSISSVLLYEDVTYSNCYALNTNYDNQFVQSMICSYPLEEANYGRTYVSLLLTSEGLAPFGISPDSNYYGNMSADYYQSIEEVVPRIGDISADFFTYDATSGLYTFDFASFLYGDDYFCGTLLLSLFGIMDPAVQNLGLYIDDYTYTFDTLTIGFDENGYPYGTLDYQVYGYPVTSSFTFSDVGTTNILERKDLEEVVKFIQLYLL